MKNKKIINLGVFFVLGFFLVLPNLSLGFSDTRKVEKKSIIITSPSSLVGSPRNQAVFLQWDNQEVPIDYLIEYKESSSGNWVTFPHEESSVEGILVNNLSNEVSYDFKVSSIGETEQSLPTTIYSITPQQNSLFTSNNQIIATGQSNAMGTNAFPALSTIQPYSNKMLNAELNAFIPLTEPITNGIPQSGETMSSAFANMVTFLASSTIPNYSSIISLNAIPGVPYTTLMQGTPTYMNALSQVEIAKNLSLLENKTLIVPAVTTVHGESDEIGGTTSEQYENYLIEWQNNYEDDIRSITGQEEPIPLFFDQMSSWTSYDFPTPRVAIGQYNAAKNHPDKIIMVTPRYIFDSVDHISHMSNYSQRRLGEYYAKVYKKIIIDGEDWKPLTPTNITLTGNTVSAEFYVPVPPLAFDTMNVMLKENYGFEYFDESNSANITDVQITSPNTVTITLSNTPTGDNPRLRYAYTGIPGSWTGRYITGSARGNLRDSDVTTALHPSNLGIYLYNWSLTFDESITVSPIILPNEPTNISALIGTENGSGIISFQTPLENGSDPIISYTATSNPGNVSVTDISSPIEVTGLLNHTTYTFTVVSNTSSGGQSNPSESSNPITFNWYNLPIRPMKPVSPEPLSPADPIDPSEPADQVKIIKPMFMEINFLKENNEALLGEITGKKDYSRNVKK